MNVEDLIHPKYIAEADMQYGDLVIVFPNPDFSKKSKNIL